MWLLFKDKKNLIKENEALKLQLRDAELLLIRWNVREKERRLQRKKLSRKIK